MTFHPDKVQVEGDEQQDRPSGNELRLDVNTAERTWTFYAIA